MSERKENKKLPATGSITTRRKTLSISYRTAYFLAVANIILIILCIIISQLMLQRVGRWLAVSSYIEPSDVIVVLGGGGQERLLYSIQLYHDGYAHEMWYTGADYPEKSMGLSDAEYFYRFAMNNGVMEEAITILPSSSTWEDAGSIAQMLESREDVNSIIVVTSWYHLRRSLNVINKRIEREDVLLYYTHSNDLSYAPRNWWTSESGLDIVTTEVLKHGYYLVRYRVAPWRTFHKN